MEWSIPQESRFDLSEVVILLGWLPPGFASLNLGLLIFDPYGVIALSP